MSEDVAIIPTGPRPVEEPPRDAAASRVEDFGAGQQPFEHELGGFISRLDAAVGRRRWSPTHRSEHWTHAAITPDLSISARNLEENEVYLLEKIADLLRRLLHRRERW